MDNQFTYFVTYLFQQLYNDSIYGFHHRSSTSTAIPNNARPQINVTPQLSTSSPDHYSRWNMPPNNSVPNGFHGSNHRSKIDLTYSYSSSEDEEDAYCLAAPFLAGALAAGLPADESEESLSEPSDEEESFLAAAFLAGAALTGSSEESESSEEDDDS